MKRQSRPPKASQKKARSRTCALRVLVVENHPSTRRGLEVFLKMLGHEVQFAEDVRTALAAMAVVDARFDVLLSDISLPDGDGWDLLRELRRVGHSPPYAVAMSGFGTEVDLEKSLAAGFRQHLVKPFPPEELEAALRAAVPAPATV